MGMEAGKNRRKGDRQITWMDAVRVRGLHKAFCFLFFFFQHHIMISSPQLFCLHTIFSGLMHVAFFFSILKAIFVITSFGACDILELHL